MHLAVCTARPSQIRARYIYRGIARSPARQTLPPDSTASRGRTSSRVRCDPTTLLVSPATNAMQMYRFEGGSTITNPLAVSLRNRPASSSIPSDAPMVPAPTQPGLLHRGDVAVVGEVDRVGLGDGVQRVVPTPTPSLHAFQDQGHDRHVHGLHIRHLYHNL